MMNHWSRTAPCDCYRHTQSSHSVSDTIANDTGDDAFLAVTTMVTTMMTMVAVMAMMTAVATMVTMMVTMVAMVTTMTTTLFVGGSGLS